MVEHSSCPICGSKDSEFRFSERDSRVLACQVCDLLFIDPYPHNVSDGDDKMSKYQFIYHEIQSPETHYSASVEFYKRYFPIIEQECINAESILDVGCGTGHLLELLGRNPNLHRVGIELSTRRVEFAKRIANCEIYQIVVEKFRVQRKFDVITMINVLSHIPNFDSLFSSIHSLLSNNGKLILKVGEHNKNVKKRSTYNWDIPDHMHFLGMNTLQFICKKYGFKEIRHDRYPLSYDLFAPYRWKSPGRSAIKNIIKRIVLITPFALTMLAKLYEVRYGNAVYSSFIVLTPMK